MFGVGSSLPAATAATIRSFPWGLIRSRSEVLEIGGRLVQALGLGCRVCRGGDGGGIRAKWCAPRWLWFTFYLRIVQRD